MRTAQKIKTTLAALLVAAIAVLGVSCTADGMNVEDGTVDQGTPSASETAGK